MHPGCIGGCGRGPGMVAANAHRGLRVRQAREDKRTVGSGEDAEKRMVRGGDGRGREGRHRLRHPGITQNCLAARVELTA